MHTSQKARRHPCLRAAVQSLCWKKYQEADKGGKHQNNEPKPHVIVELNLTFYVLFSCDSIPSLHGILVLKFAS
jgi:hypothetical protein